MLCAGATARRRGRSPGSWLSFTNATRLRDSIADVSGRVRPTREPHAPGTLNVMQCDCVIAQFTRGLTLDRDTHHKGADRFTPSPKRVGPGAFDAAIAVSTRAGRSAQLFINARAARRNQQETAACPDERRIFALILVGKLAAP